MVTNGKVRVIRFFSKTLTGAQYQEKECYGIYFGCKTFEDLLDNRHFILKTDHMNLTYLNVTLTGKVQRWKYLQDKDFYLCHVPGKEVHQYVPDALSRLCENHMLSNVSENPAHKRHQAFLASIKPKHRIPDAVNKLIAGVHNSMVGHWGLQK